MLQVELNHVWSLFVLTCLKQTCINNSAPCWVVFAYPIFKYRFATFFRGEQGLLPYLEVKTVSTVMFLEFQSTTQGLLVIPSPYFKGRLSAKPLKKRKQGFALSLVLKMRVLGTRKGPILQSGRINCLQLYPAPRSRYNTWSKHRAK